jgi:dUTP pyrophosphatase
MKVNIKKLHPNAIIPKYAKSGDAGMDLHITEIEENDRYGNIVYKTGLAMEIPDGHVGLIYARSSISKTPYMLRNHVGVIDSGYRGEIVLKFIFPSTEAKIRYPRLTYNVGDRVGQIIIMPYPKIEFNEVQELSETERGTGGFGSTGS